MRKGRRDDNSIIFFTRSNPGLCRARGTDYGGTGYDYLQIRDPYNMHVCFWYCRFNFRKADRILENTMVLETLYSIRNMHLYYQTTDGDDLIENGCLRNYISAGSFFFFHSLKLTIEKIKYRI